MPASMMMVADDAAGAERRCGYGGAASAHRGGWADAPKFVGDVAPAMKGLGGGAGIGAGMAGDLGKAHLVGAMSVPPTWQGSMPKGMASSAMAGWVGGAMNAAAMAARGWCSGYRWWDADDADADGWRSAPARAMPGGMMGRGGASPHVVQNRPSVIPRTGVG